MFNILKKIWEFLNSKVFLYIVIIIGIIWLTNMCGSNHDAKIEKKIADQNIEALKDSVKMEKKKNGEIKGSKAAFVSSLDSLKNLNRGLYNQVKEQKSEVISLSNALIGLQQDTARLNATLKSYLKPTTFINDSTYLLNWELVYNWDKPKTDVDTTNTDVKLRTSNYDIFEGSTKVKIKIDNNNLKIISAKILMSETLGDSIDYILNKKTLYKTLDLQQLDTRLTTKKSQINLTFGEEVVKDKLRVFIQSKYPGFDVKSMEGYFIDPNTDPYIKSLMKKRQWLPGTWNVSVGSSLGYNLLTSKPYIGLSVNFGYTIYQW